MLYFNFKIKSFKKEQDVQQRPMSNKTISPAKRKITGNWKDRDTNVSQEDSVDVILKTFASSIRSEKFTKNKAKLHVKITTMQYILQKENFKQKKKTFTIGLNVASGFLCTLVVLFLKYRKKRFSIQYCDLLCWRECVQTEVLPINFILLNVIFTAPGNINTK